MNQKWYQKKKWWAVFGGLIIVIVIVVLWNGDNGPTYETVIAQKIDLVQQVSVTGKVKPAQSVDLQFESSGRISSINYKVGDRVGAGAVIASLENQDLQAAVTSARADLEKVKRNFESLEDSSIYSSLRVELENATENLYQITEKADGDLESEYNSAFNAMREAMTQVDTSSVVLEYIRKTYLQTNYTWNTYIQQRQLEVSSAIGRVKTTFPSINDSGTKVTSDLYEQIDSALPELLRACQSLRSAFTYLQSEAQSSLSLILSATDRASVNTEAAAISSDLSAISNAVQGIADQQITNDKNISDAESRLASAEAAFPTEEDIIQKEAALLSAQAQLRKTLITAPFNGIVGKVDVERGQTVNSSTVIVSFISSANYQVEANITEVDISKIKIGDTAKLTLDAYGPDLVLDAVISQVDTAETVIDGVTTYKTILDFNSELNFDVRPNMTANIDIETARKTGIIAVPARSVISSEGQKIIRVLVGQNVVEKSVETGIRGSDGNIEILSGINEGDQVITFTE